MEIDQSKVSERIDEIMHKLSLNQKQLADLLGITQPAVSKYLSNRIPPAHILFKIAQISGRRMEWFLTGESEDLLYKVAEPAVTYDAGIKLEKKISLLPKEIYRRIEQLVDSILNDQPDKSSYSK
jgi:transcriptional regulator with XRE-family HTH domain